MRPVPTQPSVLLFKSNSGISSPTPREPLQTFAGTVRDEPRACQAPGGGPRVDALARAVQSFAAPDRRGGREMALHTYGTMAVDWEERVRFDRLREERLARISSLLAESELGALLCFDMTNIRYITATHIGTWAQDKLNRFCLLPQHDQPIMWDFGSAARHHQLYNPWLSDGRSRAGISTLRGAMSPESGRAANVGGKIRGEVEGGGAREDAVG